MAHVCNCICIDVSAPSVLARSHIYYLGTRCRYVYITSIIIISTQHKSIY